MDRINGADTIDIGSGRRGFRGRNAVAGIAGTEVTAAWLNAVQEELMAVVEGSGLAASSADLAQGLRAIRSLRLNHVATVGGTANALTVTLAPAPAAYDELRVLWIIPAATNTAGAVSVNINGLGAVPVTVDGANPPAGTLKANVPAMLVRNVSGFAVASPAVIAATLAEAIAATDTAKYITPATLAAAVQAGAFIFGGTTTNASNAYSASLTPPLSAYAEGALLLVKFNAANTGAATLNINGLGALNLLRPDGSALQANDIKTNCYALLACTGTSLIFISLPWAGITSGSNANGKWMRFADGRIFQTGTFSTSTSGAVSVVFPITFPTSVDVMTTFEPTAPVTPAGGANIVTGEASTSGFQACATRDWVNYLVETVRYTAWGA